MTGPPSKLDPATGPPPQAVLLEMWSGYLVSSALSVAAELGVADHLAERPLTAAELAAVTGAHEEALRRVMRMLVARGVFAEEAGLFALTPLSQCLRSETAGSVRDTLRMYGEMHWRAVGNLLHSVRTGLPAFEQVAGATVWGYFGGHPGESERFARGMANISSFENGTIARAYDFSPFRMVVDVGGGRGGFVAAVLQTNAGLRGVLYDEPHVVSEPTDLRESGMADRCLIVGGDFLESVPGGGDVYVLKRVLDGFDNEQALRILRLCRQAVPAHGRLLGINGVAAARAPYSRRDSAVLTMDMIMLALGRGWVRTEDQFRALYDGAGFRLDRVLATRSTLSILEGVPV